MNIELLPRLDPFGPGLADLAKANRNYGFLVTQGAKVNPPRTPRRLMCLLQHQLQRKGPNKPKFSFEVTMFRDVYHNHSAYGGSLIQTGPSHGVLSIKKDGWLLEIGFNNPDDTHGQVVKVLTPA